MNVLKKVNKMGKIKNKIIFVIKHIGLVMIPIGLILVVLQFIIPSVFPTSIIILIISIIFQLIGWRESFWFLKDN